MGQCLSSKKDFTPCVLCMAQGCKTQAYWMERVGLAMNLYYEGKVPLGLAAAYTCCNCKKEGGRPEDICRTCRVRPVTAKAALMASRQTQEAELGRRFNATKAWTGTIKFDRKNTGGGQEPMQFQGDVDVTKPNCIISFPGSDEGAEKNKRCADLWNTMCLEGHASTITAQTFGERFSEGVTTCCVFNARYMGDHGDQCVCATTLEYVDNGPDKSGGMKETVGCAWFSAWKERLNTSIQANQTLYLVTRDDGTIGKSQFGEKKYADHNEISYKTITLAEYARGMGIQE